MKQFVFKALIAALIFVGAGFMSAAAAQDSVWIKYDNRFLPHRAVSAVTGFDSIEFRMRGTVPVLRRYSTAYSTGYSDVRIAPLTGTDPGVLMFRHPGLGIHRPSEFSAMNFMDDSSKWSFRRSKESDHFIVFWAKEFGDNPNAASVPSALRVDIDDLLEKAEQFYDTNVNRLKMVVTEKGASYLDRYKMEIFLLYQTEWLATGSGYDNKIGALWVNPSTCKPVGSTIAHEIGHSFQYQTYCDNVLRGRPDNMRTGFRYGLVGSNGGNAFWEQCAQWQSYQDYPEQALGNYHFNVWMANHHRHFEHEWQRYASYYFHYYMAERNGMDALGRIWNESIYPEDALQAYIRLFCGGDYGKAKEQFFEYARQAATFDFSGIRRYVGSHYDSYTTQLYAAADGYWQVAYGNCPAPTGFNAIPLTLAGAGKTVKVSLVGLPVGSALAAGDPGTMVDGDGKTVGTADTYNETGMRGSEGLAYGFVALKDDNTRVYGDIGYVTAEMVAGGIAGEASFTIPDGTKRLWLVVQGAPSSYRQCPWDEKEVADDQLPYRLKVQGADVKGYVYIDPNGAPADTEVSYDLACSSAATGYMQGTIDLSADGTLTKVAQAFMLQPSSLTAVTEAISAGTVGVPAEGRVVLGLEDAAGNISYAYSATAGFYCKADGSRGTWNDNDPVWFEYNREKAVISYGHKPGSTVASTLYTVCPVLVYTKGGIQYKARIRLNMYYDMAVPVKPEEVTAENAKYRVARMTITTAGGAPIVGKKKADNVACSIVIESDYAPWNYQGTAQIRGRGNSTWLWYDKKPYRFKLDNKAEILGLAEEKDWILLANYRDPTDMMNTFAFCAGEGLGLPYTNHSRFVEVTLNGEYIGVYQLTEQVEVGKNRVNIDEAEGRLIQLDADDGPELSPDATDNFWSTGYRLPICVKSPGNLTAEQLAAIQGEFAQLEYSVKRHRLEEVNTHLAVDEMIKYLIVQMLVYNVEMAAPRSVYMYRDGGDGRWHAGPLWDFDAGYDFDWATMTTGHNFFASYEETILGSDPARHISTYPNVSSFFTDLWKSAAYVAAFRQCWRENKERVMGEFWAETQKYIDGCREAQQREARRWPIGKDFSVEVQRMKQWLTQRVDYMDRLIENYPEGE